LSSLKEKISIHTVSEKTQKFKKKDNLGEGLSVVQAPRVGPFLTQKQYNRVYFNKRSTGTLPMIKFINIKW
jgi:hypothetical protein